MREAWSDLVLGGCCAGCARRGPVLCPDCRDRLPVSGWSVEPPVQAAHPPGGVPTWTGGWYADRLRALVLAHKERGCYALAAPLGAVLAGVAGTALAGLEDPDQGPGGARLVLVPVPSRPRATRARGHDPVLRTARVAARLLTGQGRPTTVVPLLRIAGPVTDQAGLELHERVHNLAGRLAVRGRAHRALARAGGPVLVLVCDDVLTTGSTLAEAERALADVGLPAAAALTLAATRRLHPAAAPAGPGSDGSLPL